MAIATKGLTAKDENIHVYQIERNDLFERIYNQMTPEQIKALDEENERFDDMVLRQVIVHRAVTYPCPCQSRKMIIRQQKRAALLGPTAAVQMEFTQEDIDNYFNGMVVLSQNGIDKKLLLYIRQCKTCKNVDFSGDIRPMVRGIAQLCSDNMLDEDWGDAPAEKSEKPSSEEEKLKNAKYIMEDLETGEKKAADSLGEALFGTKDDNIEIRDIEK